MWCGCVHITVQGNSEPYPDPRDTPKFEVSTFLKHQDPVSHVFLSWSKEIRRSWIPLKGFTRSLTIPPSHRSAQILRSWNRSRGGLFCWFCVPGMKRCRLAFNKGMTIAAQQPRTIRKALLLYLFIIESQDQNWAHIRFTFPQPASKTWYNKGTSGPHSHGILTSNWCIGLFPYWGRHPHLQQPEIAAGLSYQDLPPLFDELQRLLGVTLRVLTEDLTKKRLQDQQLGFSPGGSICGSGRWNNRSNLSAFERRRYGMLGKSRSYYQSDFIDLYLYVQGDVGAVAATCLFSHRNCCGHVPWTAQQNLLPFSQSKRIWASSGVGWHGLGMQDHAGKRTAHQILLVRMVLEPSTILSGQYISASQEIGYIIGPQLPFPELRC